MKPDIPDIIDEIYDRIEKQFSTNEEIVTWLRAPNNRLPHQMSPNEMMKAGKARELLAFVMSLEECESTPSAADSVPVA